MTQDMVKMMSQDKMIGKREILSSSPSPWFSRFLRMTLLLLMMMVGVGETWGQVENGLYYIKIKDYNGTTFVADVFACPSQTNKTNEQPYVSGWNDTTFDGTANNTTYSFDATYFSWVIKQVKVNNQTYYVLINVYKNQYMVWDTFNNGTARAVHLETKATEPTQSSEKCFYSIYDDGTYKYIHPDQTPAANNTRGLNYKGNFKDTDILKVRDNNGRGLLQFYDGTKNDLKSTLLPKPTINDVNDLSIATVTENNGLPEGYNVRYTFGDGTQADPTATSPKMDAAGFIVRKAGTLKVVIERYGVVLTEVEYKYVEPTLQTCATPSISYDNTTGEVTINCTNPTDATIYYTTDGTTIPSSSPEMLYSTPVSITAETTFKAIATYAGRTPSEVATETITKVETPTIVNNGTNIVISCPTDGATIYYTTADTGDPLQYDPLNPPVASDHEGDTFRAIAKKNGCITSDESEPLEVLATCHLPVISLDWKTGEVTISNGTDDETIYYTTDGSDPLSGSVYGESFTISATTTIKAIATNSGMNNSTIASETFSQVAIPSIQDNGSYAISITSATEGAKIYYATGGSTPSYGTNPYVTPLNLSNVAVKAKAFKDGMVPSEEASATITLQLPTPTITFGDNNVVSFSIDPAIDGVTYKFTIDGSDPSTNGTECAGSFTLAAPATVRVIATHTDYTNSPEASMLIIQINKDFVFQQKECEDFFLTQAKVDGGYKRLTTTNIPSADIVWHFEDAKEGSDQYYYIVKNNSGDDTKEYLSFESNGFCLVSKDVFDGTADKDKFRFSVIENIENRTYFNFKVKGANKYVLKYNGNDKTDYIRVGDNATYNKAQWKISPAPTSLAEMTALISDPQFSPFTETTPKYYYIQSLAASVGSDNGPFYIKPVLDSNGTTYAKGYKDDSDKGTRWYLKEADKTNWNTYYYLVNAETGLYMNYSVGNNGDKAGVVETKVTEDTEDKDKYKYLIVKTAKDENDKDGYNIIPKMLESKANLEGNSMQLHHQNYSYALRANNSRDRADTKWIFVEDDTYIAPIVITQNLDAESNDYLKVTITCGDNLNDAYDIYYSTDGSEPTIPALNNAPTAPTYKYSSSFLPEIDATQIKAVAVLKSNHSVKSVTAGPLDLPQCETPTASINEAHQLEFTSATESSAIYYTTGTDEPTLVEGTSHGVSPLVIDWSDVNDGKTDYTAVAVRPGMKRSTAITKTVIYNTIELSNDTYTYNGSACQPTVTVKDGSTVIDPSKYTVTYSNNTNAGEPSSSAAPTVIISDVDGDDYLFYGTKSFTINKKLVGIEWSNLTWYYDNSPKVPNANATGLVTGDECSVIITVDGENADTGEGDVKMAVRIGSYTATATGLSNPNYMLPVPPSSELTCDFVIVAAHFNLSIEGWIYGSEPNPPVISEAGDYNLDTKEIKYKAKTAADYSDEVPTNVGEYTVKVKLTKNNSEETAENTKDFTITPKSLNSAPDDPTVFTRADDIAIDIIRDDDGNYTIVLTDKGLASGTPATLVEGTDYSISPIDDSNPKYVDMTVTGANNYKNSFRVLFAKVTFSKFYEEGSVIKKAGVFVTGSETGTNDYDKDMAIPLNMTANIVTSVNDDNTISIVPLDYIPQAVPVLLLSNGDVGNGFLVEDRNGGTDITDEQKASNLLEAQTSETPLQMETATVYLLYKGEFVLNTLGTLPQWMVYLPKPSGGGSGARLMILDEGSTDINGILERKNTELPYDKWFSIDGRRLNGKPTKKGLYIKNGQKAVVK